MNPFLAALALALPLVGQCGPQWLPGAPASGPTGQVNAVAFLPNGDLIAGGRFATADAAVVHNVARHDGASWHALGTGANDDVAAVAVMPNGDLLIGGKFSHAGGVAAAGIARWNGTAWAPVGAGLSGIVNALHLLPNGDLLAAGSLDLTGTGATAVAQWNGTSWSPLGAGGASGFVLCIDVLGNGDVIAGGTFSSIGGFTAGPIARWNGVAWQSLVAAEGMVIDVEVLPTGDVAFAGELLVNAQPARIAITNGVTAQVLNPPPGSYAELHVMGNGDLVAGGALPVPFGLPPISAGNVVRWDGTAWTSFGNGAPLNTVALALAGNGDLIAAGARMGPDATSANAVARWNGSSWTSVGAALPARVEAVVRLQNGDVVVGGEFTSIGGVAASNVALRRNGTFVPLGLGVAGPVTAMSACADGSLVVSGDFTSAGGGPANRVARWNGVSWSTLGNGLPMGAYRVAASANGQVIATTWQQLWHFDTVAWSPVTAVNGGTVHSMVPAPEGDFVITGSFGTTNAMRFSGGSVTPTNLAIVSPGANPGVLANDLQGDVIVARAAAAGGIQILRLSGTTWTPIIGSGPLAVPLALGVLPNGDPMIAVSGTSTRVRLWRGASTFVQFGGELTTTSNSGFNATFGIALASSRDGELVVGGDVLAIQQQVSTGLAIAAPTCPPAAAVVGTGCTGSAGPLSLAPVGLPWVGGTFHATASGFTPIALGVLAIGTQSVVVPLPIAPSGCSLFVAPDLTTLLLPQGGAADAAFAVPRNFALAGLQLRTQVVGIELDPSGGLIQLTSTNALQLIIGGL